MASNIGLGSQIFNGYIIAHAAFAAWELGVFQKLDEHNRLDLTSVISGEGFLPSLVLTICDILAAANLLARNGDGSYTLTDQGEQFLDNIGYIIWAVGGYGQPLTHLHELANGKKLYGRDVERNDFFVAKGSGEAGRKFVLPYVFETIKDIKVNRVVDIGCGSANFLITLCREYPELTAVGIDISPEACMLAEQNIKQAGLEDRISVICCGFDELIADQDTKRSFDWSKVDLITSFFMFHDLMNAGDITLKMRRLRKFLPSDAHILILDTMKADLETLSNLPVFSLGFELNHAIMGVRIWYLEEYAKVFEDAGLKTVKCHPLGVPSSWLYLLS